MCEILFWKSEKTVHCRMLTLNLLEHGTDCFIIYGRVLDALFQVLFMIVIKTPNSKNAAVLQFIQGQTRKQNFKLYNNCKQAKVWNLIRQSKKRKPSENVIGVTKWIIMLIKLMAVIIALNILSCQSRRT